MLTKKFDFKSVKEYTDKLLASWKVYWSFKLVEMRKESEVDILADGNFIRHIEVSWNCVEDCVQARIRARCIDTFWRPSLLFLFLFRLMDSGRRSRNTNGNSSPQAQKYLYSVSLLFSLYFPSLLYSPLPFSHLRRDADLRIRRNDKLST